MQWSGDALQYRQQPLYPHHLRLVCVLSCCMQLLGDQKGVLSTMRRPPATCFQAATVCARQAGLIADRLPPPLH